MSFFFWEKYLVISLRDLEEQERRNRKQHYYLIFALFEQLILLLVQFVEYSRFVFWLVIYQGTMYCYPI